MLLFREPRSLRDLVLPPPSLSSHKQIHRKVPRGSIHLVRALITSLDKYTIVRAEFSPFSVKLTFCFTVFPPEESWDGSDHRAETLERPAVGASGQNPLLRRV